MNNRQIKEPISKPWIWIIMALIMLGGIPWYLPKGSLQPTVLGVPYWMLISVAFSFILCGYLSWLCLSQWDIVEEQEREEHAHEASTEETDSPDGAASSTVNNGGE